jgi:hypothetical protein
MGLDVVVGLLAETREDPEARAHFVAQFASINRVLRSLGLPAHQEPETVRQPLAMSMIGYTGLHHLRRAAAQVWSDGERPPPVGGGADPAGETAVRSYVSGVNSRVRLPWHRGERLYTSGRGPNFDQLMLHSDAEGCYLPQPLRYVIEPDRRSGVGGTIGSSVALLRELRQLTEILELPPDLDPEGEDLMAAIEGRARQAADVRWRQHPIECHACLVLTRAAEASLHEGAALVFT